MEAKQTPLIDLLESVPRDAVLVVDHDQFSSSFRPVGRLCHEAAAALRADIDDLMCPHSAAGRPECFPAKACILAGECGCVYGAEWSRALRLADDAAESVICSDGQIQRPGVWRITREVLDADRAYLSDCLQHLAWRQMADVAEDHNTGDVIVTFRGEHPADSEATPALPTEQWRSD